MILIIFGIVLFLIMFFFCGNVKKTGQYDDYYGGRVVTICTWELTPRHLWCIIPILIIILGIVLK